jgi:hypothetical protein
MPRGQGRSEKSGGLRRKRGPTIPMASSRWSVEYSPMVLRAETESRSITHDTKDNE